MREDTTGLSISTTTSNPTDNYYIAIIVDKVSGKVNTETFFSEWQEYSDYLWTDGNYGCDCNRSIFFGEAQEYCSYNRFFVSIWYKGKIVFTDAKDG